jgi:Putative prokaryotic signal transducing protein
VDPDQEVVVKVVADETEAEIVTGLLRSNGIDSFSRDTEAIEDAFEDFIASGPREIVVRAADKDAATQLLADS